jgi:hypothetical protein
MEDYMKSPLWLTLASIVMSVPTWAATHTLTFDELPFVPVNNLTFMGVTFQFQVNGVPSTDAHYNAFGPGKIIYVQDPSLEGNAAGTLVLDFANPTPFLEFGVAMSTVGHRVTTVELFNASLVSLGLFAVETNGLATDPGQFPFTEGKFSWFSGAVKRAVINFDNRSIPSLRFALDNLTYDASGASVTLTNIPAPDNAAPAQWAIPDVPKAEAAATSGHQDSRTTQNN